MTDATEPWNARLLDGRYRLGERLGTGAVAEVYRALDERLQRPVAVKLFRGDAAAQLHRHEAEMRTLASLDHPSLVGVYDAGTDDVTDQPYLVMQLVEGPTLADELRSGSMGPDRVAAYGAALADALGYVHDRGFVHRDVKPANVLISDDGRVHLTDFGIARLVDSAHETRTGDVLGTPAYFAPEQVAGEPVGPPVDVYALGIILIECLTGHRPFEGGTPMEVALARVSRAPEIPSSLPESWRTLLAAMTARHGDARPTAHQVADNLRRISEGQDVDRTVVMAPRPADATSVLPATAVVAQAPSYAEQATAATPARRTGLRWGVVVAVVLIAAAVVVAVLVAVQRSDNATPSSYTPGKPTLHPKQLERDMQHLEKLVLQ